MRNLELKNQSIAALVVQFQNTRDNGCFGELYGRLYQKIFLYSLKLSGNRQDAYDITADTFIKAAKNIHQLKSADLFSSWISRIAHNLCMDHFRSARKRHYILLDSKFELADNSDVDSNDKKEARFNKLERSMNRVDAKTKQILTEKYLDNMTIQDLEIKYGLSKSAVKMRLSRARAKVSERVA